MVAGVWNAVCVEVVSGVRRDCWLDPTETKYGFVSTQSTESLVLFMDCSGSKCDAFIADGFVGGRRRFGALKGRGGRHAGERRIFEEVS